LAKYEVEVKYLVKTILHASSSTGKILSNSVFINIEVFYFNKNVKDSYVCQSCYAFLAMNNKANPSVNMTIDSCFDNKYVTRTERITTTFLYFKNTSLS
jgi:hypothetical protein